MNENVAGRADREGGCQGRFWEGRFRCRALLGEAASLACLALVTLITIWSNMA